MEFRLQPDGSRVAALDRNGVHCTGIVTLEGYRYRGVLLVNGETVKATHSKDSKTAMKKVEQAFYEYVFALDEEE